VVLGEGAKKLTPSVLSELKRDWTKQFHEWQTRDLSKVTFTYLYADGVYQKIRGDHGGLRAGVDGRRRRRTQALDQPRRWGA
jgi:transposase-like protein